MEIVLLSGLPRTGSTLLQNILVQNTKIHAEGNSGLCQIMWDSKISCEQNAVQQLIGAGKDVSFKVDFLKKIPSIYYPDSAGKIVFDKCRRWVNTENICMARKYIAKDVKAIVMVRPIEEIVASFARVSAKNNLPPENADAAFGYESLLLNKNSNFLGDIHATYTALNSKNSNFLFISYRDLVTDTEKTLSRIYKHIGANRFIHNTQHCVQTVFEDDKRNNMAGMHTIRPKIARKKNKVVLPDWVKDVCTSITETYFDHDLLGKAYN